MRFANIVMATLTRSDPYQYVCVPPNLSHPAMIAFGGTQTMSDFVVDDLWIKPKTWLDDNDVVVHGGFARRTLRLVDELEPLSPSMTILCSEDIVWVGRALYCAPHSLRIAVRLYTAYIRLDRPHSRLNNLQNSIADKVSGRRRTIL